MKDEALDLALEALELSSVTVDSFGVQRKTQEAITAIKQALAAPVQDRSMLECSINPRPLSHPLRDYHTAMSEGPLHYTWTDKPHRLVYDLIAAVKFYADRAAPVQEPVAHMNQNGVIHETGYSWGPSNHLTPLYPHPAPVQEPVACVQDLDEVKRKHLVYEKGMDWKDPLYTTPPAAKRQWVGLTPDDIRQLEKENTVGGLHGDYCPTWDLIESVEAKLKEKNT